MGTQRIHSFVTAVFMVFSVLLAVVVLFAGKPVDGQQRTVYMVAVFLLMEALFAWRLNLTGLYINDEALRRRYLFSSKTVPWSEVAAVGVEGMNVRADGHVDDICLELKNGKIIGTGLYYGGSMKSLVSLNLGDSSGHRGRDALMTLVAAHRKAG